MSRPSISVIVPVYNAEKYVQKCVRSLLEQTLPLAEIILIDDGSTDLSGKIIDELAEKYRSIKVAHFNNSGVSNTRNIGMDMASGDFIGFADADDWFEPDMYKSLYQALRDTNADVSVCDYQFYDEETGKCTKAGLYEAKVCLNREEAIQQVVQTSCVAWNKLFRRTVVENIRFPSNVRIGEDTLFLIDVFAASNRVAFIPEAKIFYRRHTGSAMTSDFSEKVWDNAISGEEAYNKLIHISGCLKSAAEYRLAENVLNILYKLSYAKIGVIKKEAEKIYCLHDLVSRRCPLHESQIPMSKDKKNAVRLFKFSPWIFFAFYKVKHVARAVYIKIKG